MKKKFEMKMKTWINDERVDIFEEIDG